MIATSHALIEVTDPKLYCQYNVFEATLYCCFLYLLKLVYMKCHWQPYDLDYSDCIYSVHNVHICGVK